jgi:cytochrome c peroxidase
MSKYFYPTSFNFAVKAAFVILFYPLKNFRFVNFRSTKTVLLVIFCTVAGMSFLNRGEETFNEKIDACFLQQLDSVKIKLTLLKKSVTLKKNQAVMQQEFLQCRIAYKKFAVLADYFNPYESKWLNGPAIDRIENEVADKIIPPKGFQAIEQILFDNWKPGTEKRIISLIDEMLDLLRKIETEPDRRYKFRKELTWDALRSALVQVTTTGISGFDSPVAGYALPEAAATIEGMQDIFIYFKPASGKPGSAIFSELNNTAIECIRKLRQEKNFNRFDRLSFITAYLNPFYTQLVAVRKSVGIGVPEGRSAVNYDAKTIFDPGFFSINFYSPPQEYWVTPEKVFLGRKLFFDSILSGTKTRSCASCHQPAKAFTDGLVKPYALDGEIILPRNTPTLWNSGYQTKQFFDSRTDILENQLDEVVHNAQEMQGSLNKSVKELKQSPEYVRLFAKAYSTEKEPITAFNIANAISSYVRSLVSLNSRFDQYMRGDKTRLNTVEKNGFNLFTGKAKCATCHFIPLFNGVIPPAFSETESEVLGVPATKSKLSAKPDDDLGKFLFTHSEIHKYAFKTPTLRNISLTTPYMHNGVYTTLEEVMEFYNNGGGAGLKIKLPNQTLPPEKLNLTKKEISAIISFMKTLTDTSRSSIWYSYN